MDTLVRTMVIGHRSDVAVAEKLNEMKFTLPDGSEQAYRQKGIRGRKEPGPFTKDFVRGLLTRVLYTGKVAYYGQGRKRKIEALYPGKHPALISEETFHALLELRQTVGSVAITRLGTPQRVYPLTGTIFCSKCGWPMRGTMWRPLGFTYRDAGQIDLHTACDQKPIKAIPLEKQVIELLYAATQKWDKSVSPESTTKYIEDAEANLQRAQELYIRGDITKEILEREKDRTGKILKPLQENSFVATLALSKKIQSAHANWKEISTIEQKRLLRLVIEAIFVRENALVALQPTFAFLPILTTLLKKSSSSGPDGIGNSDV